MARSIDQAVRAMLNFVGVRLPSRTDLGRPRPYARSGVALARNEGTGALHSNISPPRAARRALGGWSQDLVGR